MPELYKATASFEMENLIRDLSAPFSMLLKTSTVTISRIPNGSPTTNTKIEWSEGQLNPVATTIASFATDGDGTGITVASAAGIEIGSILGFQKATGASVTEQVRVTGVSGNALTVVRDYGSTTGVTLVVGDVVKLNSTPRNENHVFTGGSTENEGTNYNYTELFTEEVKMSSQQHAAAKYGYPSPEAYLNSQISIASSKLMQRINRAAIHGRRVQRSASESGTTGGILQFMEGGLTDTTGGSISATILNNLFAGIHAESGGGGTYGIFVHSKQARKISAFNRTGSNPLITVTQSDTAYGGGIETFISDLPGTGKQYGQVIVDDDIPQDVAIVLDLNRVSVRPNRPLGEYDTSVKNAPFTISRLLATEIALEMKDGKHAHAKAVGLTI